MSQLIAFDSVLLFVVIMQDNCLFFFILICFFCVGCFFFFQAEAGIRYLVGSRGLGGVYKRQQLRNAVVALGGDRPECDLGHESLVALRPGPCRGPRRPSAGAVGVSGMVVGSVRAEMFKRDICGGSNREHPRTGRLPPLAGQEKLNPIPGG